MIKGLLLTSLFTLTAFNAKAAVVPYGQYREISGSAVWDLTATVIEYYANLAPIADAPKVGDTARRHFEADFTGYIDNTFTSYLYTDYSYDFSNGWYATSNGANTIFETTPCGYMINFCVGQLAGPEFKVGYSEVQFYFDIAGENGGSAHGEPIFVSFSETVVIERKDNQGDYHYFTVAGTQTYAKGFTVVPLPASGALLAFAVLPLIVRRKSAKLS